MHKSIEAEIAEKLAAMVAREMRTHPLLNRGDCTARVLAGITDSRHPHLVSRITGDSGGNSRRPVSSHGNRFGRSQLVSYLSF